MRSVPRGYAAAFEIFEPRQIFCTNKSRLGLAPRLQDNAGFAIRHFVDEARQCLLCLRNADLFGVHTNMISRRKRAEQMACHPKLWSNSRAKGDPAMSERALYPRIKHQKNSEPLDRLGAPFARRMVEPRGVEPPTSRVRFTFQALSPPPRPIACVKNRRLPGGL